MRLPAIVLLLAALGLGGCDGGEPEILDGITPVLNGITPPLASAKTTVRIGGSGFTGDEVRVFFGDTEGEVLSAEDTAVWARGIDPPEGAISVDVVLEVDGQRSNALPLAIGVSGTPRPLAIDGLEDPRGVTLDAGGGLLWIFDAQSGVLVFALANGAYRVHRPPSPELLVPVAGAPLSETEILIADGAMNSIVSMDVDTAAVTPVVEGLLAPPVALAVDTAGNLYWADGGPSIGRRTAAGVIDTAFATVPEADGVAVAGGALWATDTGAGEIHRVELGSMVVTTAFASGLTGVRGVSRDGTGVVACVDDGGGVSAVRVSEVGVVTPAAPEHPFAGAAAAACENGSGTIFSIATDGGVESSRSGAPWELRAPVLANDAADALWTGGRFYIVSDSRCASGGTGAIVEVVAPGSYRSKASGVCARDTFHPRADAGMVWVDRADAHVRRLDLATGTVVVVGSNGAFAGALGAAVDPDGALFVTDAAGALRYFDPSGVEIALVSSSGAHPAYSDTLYFVDGGALHAAELNHGELLGTQTLATIPGGGATDAAPNAGGGVLVLTGTTALFGDAGGFAPAGDAEPGDRIGRTPFGELFRMRDGQPPTAILP